MKLNFGRRRLKPIAKLVFILVLFMILLAVINSYITPVVTMVIKSKIESLACEAINIAIYEELSQEDVNYSDFVSISRSNENQVLSISYNSVKINKFKTAIVSQANAQLNEDNIKNIKIPIGTLLGINIFSGRGPSVSIKAEVVGNIKTDFRSSFESAGINQTKHQIYIDVCVKMAIMLPNYDNYTDVNTSVMVAETIIVGSTPEVFASGSHTNNTSAADLAKLNNQ